MSSSRFVGAGGTLAFLFAAGPLGAATITQNVMTSGGGTVVVAASPSSPDVNLTNVLLNGSVTQTGNPLDARFASQDADVTTVRIFSDETLTGSGGQASFNAVDGSLNYFHVELVPTTKGYNAIQVNLAYGNPTGGPADKGSLVVSGLTNKGSFTAAPIAIDSSGQNYILGTTTDTWFRWVAFAVTAVDPATGGLSSVAQVRIGNTGNAVPTDEPVVVPLPASACGGMVLLGGMALYRQRRRQKA